MHSERVLRRCGGALCTFSHSESQVSRVAAAAPHRIRSRKNGIRSINSIKFLRTNSTSSRTIHSSSTRSSTHNTAATSLNTSTDALVPPPTQTDKMATAAVKNRSCLSVLPLKTVLRSLAVTTVSSSPLLLSPSLAIMSGLAHSKSPLLNPDRNPILRWALKKTFYAQFCAGENPLEVRQTIAGLKKIGFTGVLLGYAKEVVLSDKETKELHSCTEGQASEECTQKEVIPWAEGTMETVRLVSPGDFVSVKFTGAGRQALFSLSENLPPPPALAEAIDDICKLAAARGVRLLFDAEQQALQAGIDEWTMHYMRKHNAPGRCVVYNTYQAYLKATPAVLASHLRAAAKSAAEGKPFAVGAKLVRGAYLGSDPRHLIHDTKADTDACYDGVAAALLRQRWEGPLAGKDEGCEFPEVHMVLASHNSESVCKGRDIIKRGEARTTEVAFAQLQGMADEVSCDLIASACEKDAAAVKSYKYLVWGTTGECMKYLLRRAHENRDAVQRTRSGRDAMAAEVWRRFKRVFGLAA
ncbi:hypothetical protein MCOR25_000256 [Pyricularia grisea]|uniref:Proline dehydrogenase n=1 Tax=Pyricularia grisea TaxID=148305 RepID=A0A6P8APN2_PYRGI|nr:hypothetical protein PgNI_11422 [Pyricularia grisea]KAI6383069.1 hypothetical protein MCOR25_000256 [Pyricularia grisea]TLD03983.1 hypothetical protein PgNI_11422 [Pyricularia grisea]